MPDPHGTESDAALWLEAISGTPASFAAVYDRYRRRIYRKALGITGNVADAEEAVAIVFLEAWRKRTAVRIVDGSLLPWLYTTTGFVCLNLERSKRRYRRALSSLPQPDHAPDPAYEVADRIDGAIAASRVRAALNQLSQRDQVIVQLCLVDELSVAEVAETLGVPAGTVKSRLHRARAKLRALLPQDGAQESRLIHEGGDA